MDYNSFFKDNDMYKEMLNFAKKSGRRGTNFSSSNETKYEKIEQTEVLVETETSISSVSEWEVMKIDLRLFIQCGFSFIGENYFIGFFDENLDSRLTLNDYSFNKIFKWGILCNQSTQWILKENEMTRNFDLFLTNRLFVSKVENRDGTSCVSIGTSDKVTRTIKIDKKCFGLYIGVKKGLIKLKKETIPIRTSWNQGDIIEIDATEVDVLYSSQKFSSLTDRAPIVLEVVENTKNIPYSLLLSEILSPGSTFVNTDITGYYEWGLIDKKYPKVYSESKLIDLNEMNLYQNENEILFEYYGVSNFIRIGSRRLYKTFTFNHEEDTYFTASIHVKNTILKLKILSSSYNWIATPYYESYTLENEDIKSFALNPNLGIKINLVRFETYYFPSVFFGLFSNNDDSQYFFEFDTEEENVYIGFINDFGSRVDTSTIIEGSNMARVNLTTGNVEVDGEIQGTLEFNYPKTLIIGVKRLVNNTILFSTGVKSFTVQKVISRYFEHSRLYITGSPTYNTGIGSFKLNPINIVPEYTIPPIIPSFSPTELYIQNIFDENSDQGGFRLSSNFETSWNILAFDFNEQIIAANFSCIGFKMFIGLVPSLAVVNGLQSMSTSQFNAIEKNGVFGYLHTEKITKIVNNIDERNIKYRPSLNFYCKFTSSLSDICMSIGNSNFNASNLKLPSGSYKIVFAVSMASCLFSKRRVSDVIKTEWNIGTEIEFDAIEYDVQIPSPILSSNKSYFFNRTGNSSAICDLVLVDASKLSLPLNTLKFMQFTEWNIIYKNMKNCYIKNLTETVQTGSSPIDEKSLYMRYGTSHTSMNSPFVFFGTHPHQYVSNYAVSKTYYQDGSSINNIIPASPKFAINVKYDYLKIVCVEENSWNDEIKENIFNITNEYETFFMSDNYDVKNTYWTVISNNLTLISKSINVNVEKFICFEYENHGNQLTFGIKEGSSNLKLELTDETTNIASMNLSTGVATINSISSTKPVANNSHKIIVLKIAPSTNGVVVSLGTNYLNASQEIEIPNMGLRNFSFFFSAANVLGKPLVTLKRVSFGGIVNNAQPVDINYVQPPTYNPALYSPFQRNSTLTYTLPVTASSNNDKWTILNWDEFVNTGGIYKTLETYGNYEITQYGNKQMEWFIGYSFKKNVDDHTVLSHNVYEYDDDEFHLYVPNKYGIYYNGSKEKYVAFDTDVPLSLHDPNFSGGDLYTRMFYEMGKRTGTRDGAILGREILHNVVMNLFAILKAIFTGDVFDLVDDLGYTEYDKRVTSITFTPSLGSNCYNLKSFSKAVYKAFRSSGLSLINQDHFFKFVIAVKNGSITYQTKNVLDVSRFAIDEMPSQQVSIGSTSQAFVYKGLSGTNNLIKGMYIEGYENIVSNGGSWGFVLGNYNQTNTTFYNPLSLDYSYNDDIDSYKLSKQYFENLTLFNSLDFFSGYNNPLFVSLGKPSNDNIIFDNRNRDGDWEGLGSYTDLDLYIEATSSFVRYISLDQIGYNTLLNKDFIVQEGSEYGFYTHKVSLPGARNYFEIPLIFETIVFDFRSLNRIDNSLIPYVRVVPMLVDVKFTYHKMDSLDNDVFRSKWVYQFDGNTDESPPNEKFSHEYLRNTDIYKRDISIKSESEFDGYLGGGLKMKLCKSHTHNNQVSFLSGTDVGCAFNYEIYNNQSVYFGIVPANEYASGFTYLETAYPLTQMLMYVNLLTGEAFINGNLVILPKLINSFQVKTEYDKKKSTLTIKKFGFLSPHDVDFKWTNTDGLIRFVITCDQTTSSDILIMNSITPRYNIK